MTDEQLYGVIGEDGFARLVHAFYAQVPGDEILGALYIRRTTSLARSSACATSSSDASAARRATSSSAAIRGCGCATCRSRSTRRRAIDG